MTTTKVRMGAAVVAPETLKPGALVLCTEGDWERTRTAKSADPLDEVFYAEVKTPPVLTQFATKTVMKKHGHVKQWAFEALVSGELCKVYVPAGHNVPVVGSLVDSPADLARATA